MLDPPARGVVDEKPITGLRHDQRHRDVRTLRAVGLEVPQAASNAQTIELLTAFAHAVEMLFPGQLKPHARHRRQREMSGQQPQQGPPSTVGEHEHAGMVRRYCNVRGLQPIVRSVAKLGDR
jgi:hypothetical protein